MWTWTEYKILSQINTVHGVNLGKYTLYSYKKDTFTTSTFGLYTLSEYLYMYIQSHPIFQHKIIQFFLLKFEQNIKYFPKLTLLIV